MDYGEGGLSLLSSGFGKVGMNLTNNVVKWFTYLGTGIHLFDCSFLSFSLQTFADFIFLDFEQQTGLFPGEMDQPGKQYL